MNLHGSLVPSVSLTLDGEVAVTQAYLVCFNVCVCVCARACKTFLRPVPHTSFFVSSCCKTSFRPSAWPCALHVAHAEGAAGAHILIVCYFLLRCLPQAKRMAVPRYLWLMLKGLWEQAAQDVTHKAQQQQQQQQPNGNATEVLDLTEEAPPGGAGGDVKSAGGAVEPAGGVAGEGEGQGEGLKEHAETAQPPAAAAAAAAAAEENPGGAAGDASAPGSPRPTCYSHAAPAPHAAPPAGATVVPPCPEFPSQTSVVSAACGLQHELI
eukprot:1160133-Pelagomonas_calceolata.AAC.5